MGQQITKRLLETFLVISIGRILRRGTAYAQGIFYTELRQEAKTPVSAFMTNYPRQFTASMTPVMLKSNEPMLYFGLS